MLINLDNVPQKPGIYIWKKDEEILYIGKANNLKNRMSQYYKGMLNSFKTTKLVEEINNFEYIITSSEKEALILEQNYIHKYMPRFNILLKDSKRYPYIKISLTNKLNISLVYRVSLAKKKKRN
ncbi:MAG: GIY-YIG nuclease family protein [Mycoplasmataceae bacterium]|nr:GIY-YIG nuclease family protein [Mycoplasmataceae bacterium]